MLPKINIGNFSIPSLLFFWCVGIIISQVFYVFFGKNYNLKWYQSLTFGLTILFLEIISAKILFILESLPEFDKTFLSLTGGYSLYGVFLFMPLFLIPISYLFFKDINKLLNFASVGILIELAFYRIGCFCSGCCGGIEMVNGLIFPAQLVEMAFDIFLSVIIIVFANKNNWYCNNMLSGVTYISYGTLRFIIEFFRERENIILNMSISHILSIATIIIGMIFVFADFNKNSKNKQHTLNDL